MTRSHELPPTSRQTITIRRQARSLSLGRAITLFLIFALGTASALFWEVYKTADLGGKATPTSRTTTAEDPEPVAHSGFIEPLFGPVAVERCETGCSAQIAEKRQACARGCRYLSLRNYGRRVTLETALDPLDDANVIIQSCLKKEVVREELVSSSLWEEEIRRALDVVQNAPTRWRRNDLGGARLLYDTMVSTNQKTKFPPGGTSGEIEITERLIRTTCLRAHLTLTEMALIEVMNNSDSYSRRFYTNLRRQPLNATTESETSLLARAKDMGLI